MFKKVTATKIKELKKKKRFQQKMRASDEKTLSTINRQGALYTLRAFTFLVRLASILRSNINILAKAFDAHSQHIILLVYFVEFFRSVLLPAASIKVENTSITNISVFVSTKYQNIVIQRFYLKAKQDSSNKIIR